MLAATAVLDFAVLGPFSDPWFDARRKTFGPEEDLTNATASGGRGQVNFSKTYMDTTRNTSLGWARVTLPQSKASPSVLRLEPLQNGSVSFVFTHVFVPEGIRAVITGSTSALATVYVNSKVVLEDRIVSGLVNQEWDRGIELQGGQWNQVQVGKHAHCAGQS
jgi:hypothetical protein